MYQLYKVSIASGVYFEAGADVEMNLHPGDAVIVKCEHFTDFALVRSISRQNPFENFEEFSINRAMQNKGRHLEGNQLPQIQRRATADDRKQIKENDVRCNSIHERTLGFIAARHLQMKLINTHYTFDRRMLLFSFSAEGRVDFRELLRDTAAAFHARIELRQIGVRDEASAIGGLGTCGRPLCCSTFLCNVGSVNVRMAKQQGLSLNPQNISGCCSRLKCCLQFEADSYKDCPVMHRSPSGEKYADSEVPNRQMTENDSGRRDGVESGRRRGERGGVPYLRAASNHGGRENGGANDRRRPRRHGNGAPGAEGRNGTEPGRQE